jgi:hypothetical protein
MLVAESVRDGTAFTKTVIVDVEIQPNELSVEAVYVVVMVGVSVMVAELSPVGFHVYVPEPPADNVIELPAQIEDCDTEVVIVGIGFTITLTVFSPLQPNKSSPVTVYVTLVVGLDIVVEPFVAIGLHV